MSNTLSDLPTSTAPITHSERYGRLTVICGPMFSGKTTELLKRILWARNGLGRRVVVFKPAFDKRYARENIVSHEGLTSEALAVNQWEGISERLIAPDDAEDQRPPIVFFDEIQFFVEPHFEGDFVEIVRDLLKRGIEVCCAGLDMDWRGVAFTNSAMVAAMAEELIKLTGICAVCGQPGTRSFKKSGIGDAIELGGVNLYECRCTRHWAEEAEQVRLL